MNNVFYHTVMCPKDADGLVITVDPDHTAPKGAVLSGSTLTVCADLSVKKLSTIYIYEP